MVTNAFNKTLCPDGLVRFTPMCAKCGKPYEFQDSSGVAAYLHGVRICPGCTPKADTKATT